MPPCLRSRPLPLLLNPPLRHQIVPLFCMNAKKAAGVAETRAAGGFEKKTNRKPVDKDFARHLAREYVRAAASSQRLACAPPRSPVCGAASLPRPAEA